jgi:hypothetical protein
MLTAIRGGVCRLRWVVPVLAVIVPLAFPGAASADSTADAESYQYISTSVAPVTGSDAEYDNQAVATQTSNGQTAFTLTFKYPVTYASVITANNTASATAGNCENCNAIAISFQAVTTVKPDLAELTAHDVASATSNTCTNCNTLAESFQVVYAPESSAPMSAAVGEYILNLKLKLDALQNSGLSVDQIQSESTQDVKTLVSELQAASDEGSMMIPGINGYDLPAEAAANAPLVDLLSTFQF